MADLGILVADADAGVRNIIRLAFAERDWPVTEARDGVGAIKLLRRSHFVLLILEVELPIINGLMVAGTLSPLLRPPIIFISGQSAERDRLDAFEAGGNDFLSKPFYPRELVARAQNLIGLTQGRLERMPVIAAGGIAVDLQSQIATVDGRAIRLSPREYRLLVFLCRNPNRVFTRTQLLDLVWGIGYEGVDRTVDTHIKSLRDKIAPYQDAIKTVWGYGYMFEC